MHPDETISNDLPDCKKPNNSECTPICTKKGQDVELSIPIRSKCNVSW